jgi:hypothetical protein
VFLSVGKLDAAEKFTHNALSAARSLENKKWNVILPKSEDNFSKHHRICYVMKYVRMLRNNRFSTACEVIMCKLTTKKCVYLFSIICIKYYSSDTFMEISGFS